ncbi:MAG: helix-turn-helix domain-containing protein [Mycobacterium sp.]
MARYRLLPTAEQAAVLAEQCRHARYVWNLALEQHRHWRPARKPCSSRRCGTSPGLCGTFSPEHIAARRGVKAVFTTVSGRSRSNRTTCSV